MVLTFIEYGSAVLLKYKSMHLKALRFLSLAVVVLHEKRKSCTPGKRLFVTFQTSGSTLFKLDKDLGALKAVVAPYVCLYSL